ncbi:hypothetical protein P8631_00910 [Guyparkeria sp. 1SP6A2]|nr:hypothetical protein [Guyparkeria sp. 1SP6A2]
MKKQSIKFNGDMARAILDGRKTQTRRVACGLPTLGDIGVPFKYHTPQGKERWGSRAGQLSELVGVRCPYGQPGDRLWVQEEWTCLCTDDGAVTADVAYKADGTDIEHADGSGKSPWVSPDEMPRWASRITLEITDVRVERLQEIGEADAEAEGAEPMRYVPDTGEYVGWSSHQSTPTTDAQRIEWGGTYKDGLRFVWESIKGPDSWDENPWVWVVEFELVEAEGVE